MVQTYGVAPESAADPLRALDADEGQALLGASSAPVNAKADGRASLTSCISNLANTIIGSGTCQFAVSARVIFTRTYLPGMLTFPLVHIAYLCPRNKAEFLS